MLQNAKDLIGFRIEASDGMIGEIEDFYFDDEQWFVRYLVVDTGTWMTGRKVLIPPHQTKGLDWENRALRVELTRDQVRHSPDIDTHKPVSRQREEEYLRYYGWPHYWGFSSLGLVGTFGTAYPAGRPSDAEKMLADVDYAKTKDQDTHLRSAREVRGYALRANDGEFGSVDDYIIDLETWRIRYLDIDTVRWWPSKHALISPEWANEIDWSQKRIFLGVSKDMVKSSPEYDPYTIVDREYERRLFEHYGKPYYWVEDTHRGRRRMGGTRYGGAA